MPTKQFNYGEISLNVKIIRQNDQINDILMLFRYYWFKLNITTKVKAVKMYLFFEASVAPHNESSDGHE